LVGAALERIAGWAAERPDIHAAVLVGSHARTDEPADEFSDIDVALFVDDPARYVRDATWLRRFGEPLLTSVEPTAVGRFEERRVLFRDGLEVDFAILPATIATALPPELDDVLRRGYRVLYDGIGLEAPHLPAPSSAPPTQAQFDQLSNAVWYHVLLAAKKLRRGETLLAKQTCDGYLVDRLAELARWRAHGRDTWHGFRLFERWAGDDVVEALGPTFARYERADIARALRATVDLIASLEDDVARRFGLVVSVDRAEVLRRLDA
jgi:aminoglycoside 6-adenylyltransferase